MRRLCMSLLALVLVMCVAPDARGQIQLASRGPRFFSAKTVAGKRVDASGAAVLQRRVAVALTRVTVDAALKEIARQADLELIFSPTVLPPARTVTLHATDITVAGALTVALLDSGLDVLVLPGGQMGIVPREEPKAEPMQLGTVVGRVTDGKTGGPLAGAEVTVEGTRRSGTSGNDGRYRITEVPPGTYTVRARYIGYTPGATSATVTANQEVTADFALEKSAQKLDEVVTTGTVVPTEVKALPTPVSVISASDIAQQRPHTLQELLRQVVPGAVSWDVASAPYSTAFSARGANTLSGGTAQMKIFIDGVEAATPNRDAVDPSSIERVEVVRGPEAAAIYGSDAIGGVVQIVTKRGDSLLSRPQVDAEAELGVVQTPYSDYGEVFRQDYKASLRGRTSEASYSLGAGYSHTGDYALPATAQAAPSAYAGVRFSRGVIEVDVSGRYYTENVPSVFNPDLLQTGFGFFARPYYQSAQGQNQTLGAQISLTPVSWWRHAITVGVDRFSTDVAQTQPRLTTPADTLLSLFNENDSKASIRYSSSVLWSLNPYVSGTLTAGFDHYDLRSSTVSASGAQNTTGTIRAGSIAESRTITNNTGYFAQAQVNIRDKLFLTGGIRAEKNTNFGDSLGTPVSPRFGVSYVQPLGTATLKIRGSYGRAMRAPSPGQKIAFAGPTSTQLANPTLGPERQKGWDAGMDAVFGSRASMSLTYYAQTAEDLIDFVSIDPSASPPSYQFQNVARIKNTGVEIEGSVYAGPVTLTGQYAYVRSRVDQLAPNYAGDLRVDDQAWLTPKHTAGASLSLSPRAGTTIAAGVVYVGSWTYYSFLDEFRCFGGTGPCQPTTRDYLVEYPGFVKLNVNVSQQITPWVSGFVAVHNLSNEQAHEFFDFYPVIGRITNIGLRFRY